MRQIKIFCLRLLIIAAAVLFYTGCKLNVSVPAGGKVVSESGSYECQAGQVCTIDIYDLFFDETFIGEPATGYGFVAWRKVDKGLCPQKTDPCRIQSALADRHPFFMQILESDDVFHLVPVFAKPDTWLQLGGDIPGESAYDETGRSVSFSSQGHRLAVGAPCNSSNGSCSGHVRVLTWSGTHWKKLGVDIEGAAGNDRFGTSVSLSADGKRLAVGAPRNDFGGLDSGQVQVYTWAGASWQPLGDTILGAVPDDKLGYSVSLSADGNMLAVGVPLSDRSAPDAGYVRVYTWKGERWQPLGSDIVGKDPGGASGFSVSLSANKKRLAIGTPFADINGVDSGQVSVYDWSGSDWLPIGGIPGESQGIDFGHSVSLSADGNRLAIGAPDSSTIQNSAGQVRVYTWTGRTWAQLGDAIHGESALARSGWSVSLSADGEFVAIGARTNSDNEKFSGQVRVYRWSDPDWVQIGQDMNGKNAEDQLGYSVSLSADGAWLAAGATAINGLGYARVFGAPLLD